MLSIKKKLKWNLYQEQSARVANVRAGIDYSETIHNYLSTRPSDIIMKILQVSSIYTNLTDI